MLEPSSSEEEDDEVVDAPGYLGPPRQTGQNGSVPGRGPAGDGVPNGRPPTGPGTTGATDKELQGDKDKDAPAVSEDKTLTEAELKVSSAIDVSDQTQIRTKLRCCVFHRRSTSVRRRRGSGGSNFTSSSFGPSPTLSTPNNSRTTRDI